MNKKNISIFVIIVIFIGYVIYSMFWMGPGTSPISYVNIQEFEKSENVKVHHFYDIEEYIMNDKKELLIDSSKKFHITGKTPQSQYVSYGIETEDLSSSYSFTTDNSTSIVDNKIMETHIGNGVFYQYHYKDNDDKDTVYIGQYITNDFNYTIKIICNHLEEKMVEKKMIDYIKLVENIKS
ncbi:MAG: hypothetical protein HFF37_06210 [Coprobacillus sp.]|nr:hypothetical protein [Coprobacillus sp.]